MAEFSVRKQQLKRAMRTRSNLSSTKARPRLTIFRSNKHLYAQIIDDTTRKTLISISEKALGTKEKMTKVALAKSLGTTFAKLASEKKIKTVVFDKGRYTYHGRIKAFADGAREGGLQF
ncbi:MAG TPA: 50S ribosomal protein L18 [Patescibacteria group bacterium]|nr:50S ribosomal protein L18 [Patescibacteria group bacterium]